MSALPENRPCEVIGCTRDAQFGLVTCAAHTVEKQPSAFLEALYAAREQQHVREEAEMLKASLRDFITHAWHVLKPYETFKPNWHIDAVCYHFEAVSAGEIKRLQVWVPPGTMKSLNGSVMWPAWEWTFAPQYGYWAASYDLALSWRLARLEREVIQSLWYQARWGDVFELTKAADGEFANDKGGHRISTAPKSRGVGLHGHRILIDDAVDATSADANSKVTLLETNDWYDSTIPGRLADHSTSAIVNIQQRLHESDLAAHLLDIEDWVVLCLPERFETGHDFAWRGNRVHPAIKKRVKGTPLRKGDPRRENDLLWPAHRDEAASAAFARTLRHRAAGQLQQRPAPREGEIIQRSWWRFYDQTIRTKEEWHRLPRKIQRIVISVDCPQKDKQTNDCFAMQCWGVAGADRFLLDLDMGQMNYNKAKRRVKEMALWARRTWRTVPHNILIENAGYGVEMITDLKREVTGVTKLSHSQEGDKIVRADAASDAVESHNVYLPGIGPPAHPEINEHATSADIVDFVNNLATFPFASYDDDVDAWSQCMNWLREKQAQPARFTSPAALIRGGR